MRLLGGFAAVLLSAYANAAAPPPPAKVLNVDLEPGIRASALRPERFAVDVPTSANSSIDGSWSRANGVSTWRHALRIPTAVSMSFHARTLVLPAGAVLRVTAGTSSVVYRQSDTSAGGLWGRVLKGDTLGFEITVPTSREAEVAFDLASLQAGYRSLGGAVVADHPTFKKLRAMNAIATAATCTENFSCHETAGNFGPRNATAAIVVAGVSLCTATLINNVREDTKPYLLSARHCQVPGSGDSSIAVYWDGVVPCSAALGSVYDTLVPVRLGGRTVVEQQDVWLIDFQRELDATHAYFAGWDATGGTFVGGYSPHHALGRSRQYTGWFGQPILHDIADSALGTGYRGTFWGLVNQVGNVGGGASGGGLFDPNNRLVGTGSLAVVSSADDEGICPVSSPSAPSATNTAAEYNAFSAVWDSTADTTSTTNPRTLKSVLDPDNTGTMVVDGFELLKGAYIHTNAGNIFTGNPLTLTWNAPGATSCTAEGGRAGDGWGGSIPTGGSRQLTEEEGGDVDYAIRCTDGSRKAYATVRMNWTETTPSAALFANPSYDVVIGGYSRFTWFSNTRNCVGSGGAPGDGWAGPKSQSGPFDVLMTEIGSHTYTLTCTAGSRVATSSLTITTTPPYAYLSSYGLMDNLRVGQTMTMFWAGVPNCVRSGGSPGDGWADPTPMNIPQNTDATRDVVVTVPGTYTFTITCSGGGQSAAASITRTFNDLAPYVNVVATPDSSSVGYFWSNGVFRQAGTPAQISWTSNLPNCQVHYAGPGGIAGDLNYWQQLFNVGSLFDTREVIGQYTYSVSCMGSGQVAVGTATIDWTTPQQSIRVWVPPTIVLNQGFPVMWESNVQPCTGAMGIPGDGWAGAKPAASGTSSAIAPVGTPPGTYTFRIECGGVAAETTTTVPEPTVSVVSNVARLQVGFAATVDWSATVGPCVLTSDPYNQSWTGSQYASGRAFIGVSNPGPITLTATCGPANAQISASTQVIFDPSPVLNWSLTASKSTANINELVTLTWNSTSDYCSASADTTVNDWNGGLSGAGTAQVSRPIPGTVTYRLSCNNIGMREVQITFIGPSDTPNPFLPPLVAMTASHTQRLVGESVTLTWSSIRASECFASGGQTGDGWTGALSLSSTQTVTETIPGHYNYSVMCFGAPPAGQAMVTVQFLAPASNGGSNASGGGGKGGGRLDWLMLALLALLISQAARDRRGSGC
jgi:hypothetical protein